MNEKMGRNAAVVASSKLSWRTYVFVTVHSRNSALYSHKNKTQTAAPLATPAPHEKFGHTSLFLASGYPFKFWVPGASSTGSSTSKTHLMKKSGGLSDMCPFALMACQHQRPALIFCNAGSD